MLSKMSLVSNEDIASDGAHQTDECFIDKMQSGGSFAVPGAIARDSVGEQIGSPLGIGRGSQFASMIEHHSRATPVHLRPQERLVRDEHVGVGSHSDHSHAHSQDQTESPAQAITELIRQLGSEIRTQVASSLAGISTENYNSGPSSVPQSQQPDWSKVNLVLRSDVKEPPYFRGDGTDTFTVTEWQEIMQSYLSKKRLHYRGKRHRDTLSSDGSCKRHCSDSYPK